MTFDREQTKTTIADLAARGVRLGTSSWKYAGWFGQLYERDRYIWRGKFSDARFERNCLAEYAQVFKTVSLDAAYYQFPKPEWLAGLVAQVPADFQFSLKVTDEITMRSFPNLPRFGQRAGRRNEHFLDAERFRTAFLAPCEPHRANIGLVMFEFSQFHAADFARGREFIAVLDEFLGRLPRGWRYGVEIRNRNFLQPEYFAMLARHGVVHIYNSWQDMPPVGEQMALPGSRTNPELIAARFLLKPGRKYEDAVKRFSPYTRLQEPYLDGRKALVRLILDALWRGQKLNAFIYLNNRLEGNALESIAAVLDELRAV